MLGTIAIVNDLILIVLNKWSKAINFSNFDISQQKSRIYLLENSSALYISNLIISNANFVRPNLAFVWNTTKLKAHIYVELVLSKKYLYQGFSDGYFGYPTKPFTDTTNHRETIWHWDQPGRVGTMILFVPITKSVYEFN